MRVQPFGTNTWAIDSAISWPKGIGDAGNQVFLRQPILTPLLPIPPEFFWHVQTDDGYMEFRLESKTVVGEMPILFIRRKGVFTLTGYYQNGIYYQSRFQIEREGITAYAQDRFTVLEDRTCDIVSCDNENLNGIRIDNVTKLVQSRYGNHGEPFRMAPLYAKFLTNGRKPYLYDAATGRILEIDDVIYSIIDNYGVFSHEEILQNSAPSEVEKVSVALRELDEFQKASGLPDHRPTELSPIKGVFFEGKSYSLDEFWRKTASLLLLGITEKCNLRCEYCCYGGGIAGQRFHSDRSMSFDTARKAIIEYLGDEQLGQGVYPITFYGGEPLLEFDLLQRIVYFAEDLASKQGKTVNFAITTNGTLLDVKTLDFLVKHEFFIMVSLDGPRLSHDRYRVFPDKSGSFDVVDANLRRFTERYPTYDKRGVSVTLVPPILWDETSEYIETIYPHYPYTRVSLASTGNESRFGSAPVPTTQYGCHSVSGCGSPDLPSESCRFYTEADRMQLSAMWNACIESVKEGGIIGAKEKMPFAMLLFEPQIDTFYHRTVREPPLPWKVFVPCFPGFTRRFCDAEGNYRVCERVDDSEMYRLGNVHVGLDTKKLHRVMEMRRHFGDCGNCIALKTCHICYAKMLRSDAADSGFDPLFDIQCQQTRQVCREQMKTFTEVCEANPTAYERPRSKQLIRLNEMQYEVDKAGVGLTSRQQLEHENF